MFQLPLLLNQGECHKLSQWDLGQSPGQKTHFGEFLTAKNATGSNSTE